MQLIPLSSRLKRKNHREVAFAQDILVAEAYDALPACVLHGGTAIWRCYGGTRFSEDIDAYLPRYTSSVGERLRRGLAAKGMMELKFKATSATVFGKFELGGAVVSFEGTLRAPSSHVIRSYETLSGGSMLVSTLSTDDLLIEKATAYGERRKVRDLYDVCSLLDRVENKVRCRKSIVSLLKGYGPPSDESLLKAVVLAGAVPSAQEMKERLESWARRST